MFISKVTDWSKAHLTNERKVKCIFDLFMHLWFFLKLFTVSSAGQKL